MREKPAECDVSPSLRRPTRCPQPESNLSASPQLRPQDHLTSLESSLQTLVPPPCRWLGFLFFSLYTATSIHVSTGGSRTMPLASESHACSLEGFSLSAEDLRSFQPSEKKLSLSSASLEPFLITQKFSASAYNPTQPSLFREWATNCCQKTNTERAGMPGGLDSITVLYFSDGL